MTEAATRAGFVALIGEPNAGKSSLMNRIVGSKVSIVTHKVQTTRGRIRGIALRGQAQIVFVDTPGLFRPRRRLDRAMVAAAWAGAVEADAVVLLVEAHRGVTDGVRTILEGLAQHMPDRPPAIAINKIDRVARDRLLPLAAELEALARPAAIFMVSATGGSGVGDLTGWLADRMPEGPWLYPEDQIADMPLRSLAAELTREALMLRLHEELPYQLTVETEAWEEREDGSVRIGQVIYVARESHKPIALGKGGQTVKAVGQEARTAIGRLLERPVHLFLQVKVRPGWLDEPDRYRAMGLDFSDGG